MLFINMFLLNIPILHPLKTPEHQKISVVFRGCKMETIAGNELVIIKGNITKFIRV